MPYFLKVVFEQMLKYALTAGKSLGGRKAAVAAIATAIGSMLYAILGGADFQVFVDALAGISE